MFRAQAIALSLMRTKQKQLKAAREFEKGYMSLYHQRPGKRKGKISKLLLESQAKMMKERIFIGSGSLQDYYSQIMGMKKQPDFLYSSN